MGLLPLSQWGLFTESFGLLDEKENLVLTSFFSPKLKLSGDLQFNFLENRLHKKKEILKKSDLKSQSTMLVIKVLEVI